MSCIYISAANDLGWAKMLTKVSHLQLIRYWCATTGKKSPPESSHGKPRFGPKSNMATIIQGIIFKWA